jgi:hypothetical protein
VEAALYVFVSSPELTNVLTLNITVFFGYDAV